MKHRETFLEDAPSVIWCVCRIQIRNLPRICLKIQRKRFPSPLRSICFYHWESSTSMTSFNSGYEPFRPRLKVVPLFLFLMRSLDWYRKHHKSDSSARDIVLLQWQQRRRCKAVGCEHMFYGWTLA